MGLLKLAAYASSGEIKNNYLDDRSHWRKHKGKYVGGILAGPLGITIGALHFDRNRREKDFNNKDSGYHGDFVKKQR